jgi:hypothetical protein
MKTSHIFTILFVIALAGCASERSADDRVSISPGTGEIQVFEIVGSDGYAMETYEISTDAPVQDTYDRWKAAQQQREMADKYQMYQRLRESDCEKSFAEQEEDRIESYCKDNGYETCKRIDVTCEEDGCHNVTVSCDDDNFDPAVDEDDECRHFSVTVEESIDPELTEKVGETDGD